jgi:dihydroneopterin aldolase
MATITGIIRLENAVFYAYHGVLSDEQNLGGKFHVDAELECDITAGATTDHLKDTVNYERVYERIRELVMGKKYFLIEALAHAIASGILKEFKAVRRVTIRVRKPGAPIKGVVDHVEVEVTESRGRGKKR